MSITNAVMDRAVLIFLFEKFLDRFRSLESQLAMPEKDCVKVAAHINKLLEILVEAGQILLPFVIFGNQRLFALEELLPGLFKLFAFCMFVTDSCNHQFVLVRLAVLGMQFKKFFLWY